MHCSWNSSKLYTWCFLHGICCNMNHYLFKYLIRTNCHALVFINCDCNSRFCFGVVYSFSCYGWIFFRKKKSQIEKILEWLLVKLFASNYKVKFVRCGLQLLCEDNGVTLEYTASHAPQTTGVVKRRFSVSLDHALPCCYVAGLIEASIKLL